MDKQITKDFKMKKLIIGLTLLSSFSVFADTSVMNCEVTNSSGELANATTATVKFYDGNNVLINFKGSEQAKVRIIAEKVEDNKNNLKVVRKGPDAEKRTFTLDKDSGQVVVILKDDTFFGFGGDIYATAEMSCQ